MRIGEAKNKDELVTALEDARQRRLELRRPWETIWWNNLALLAGDHYAMWNPSLSRFEDRDPNWLPTNDKKPRLVVNHALTVARTELAKLTKSRPIMEVIANSDEPQDIAATKVGKSVLDYAEWKFKMPKLQKRAMWWMIPTGLAAIYCGYDFLDDEAGEMTFTIDPLTNDPVFDPARIRELHHMADEGQIDMVEEEKYPLGELEYKVYSPFQLLPDETALDFEEIKDLITTEAVDVDVLCGIFGKAARDVKPEDVQLGVMEQRMMMRMGLASPTDSRAEHAAQVHTFWLLPGVYRDNDFLKDGIHVVWVSGRKILSFSERFPFQDNRMPFAFFQHVPTDTTIWPDSVLTHIRGPNLELDKTISQIIENKDYMANPMWRIATQHKIKGEVKNVAGGIIRYVHVPNVPPPEPVLGMQMPPQVENLLAGLRAQILDVSGQSEVARGRVPTGVRSGVAVAYLQEEDDTKIAPTIENIEQSIAYLSSLTLSRVGEFYTFQRILRYYRRDGVFEALKFKGADLKNNVDVVPQAGSAMPKSKAARQQYALELISLGVLRDPKKIEEILELGAGEPDDNEKATAQANRENNTMLHGMAVGAFKLPQEAMNAGDMEKWAQQTVSAAVPVRAWHNHQLHLARHTSQMMEEEFDKLQISHPEIVRLFDEHITLHQQFLQQEQQQQMQMMMAMKGAPEGIPGGTQNGGQGPSFMQQQDVPDVIGGGTQQMSARTIRGG